MQLGGTITETRRQMLQQCVQRVLCCSVPGVEARTHLPPTTLSWQRHSTAFPTSPDPWQPPSPFPSLWQCYANEITQYVTLEVGLFHSIQPFRYIQVVSYAKQFMLICCWVCWTIHLWGMICSFVVFAYDNRTTVKNCVQVSMWTHTFISLVWCPGLWPLVYMRSVGFGLHWESKI